MEQETNASCLGETLSRLPVIEGIAIATLCAYAPTNEIALYGSLIAGGVYLTRRFISSLSHPGSDTQFNYNDNRKTGEGKLVGTLDYSNNIQDFSNATSGKKVNIKVNHDAGRIELRQPFQE